MEAQPVLICFLKCSCNEKILKHVNVLGSNYYVRILSTIDRELLKPSASVALHKHSNALVDVLPPEADSSISMLQPGMFMFQYSSYIILISTFQYSLYLR